MKNSLTLLFLVVFFSSAVAQRDSLITKRSVLTYSNSFMIGGLFGEDGSDNTFTAGMNHGIRYGRLATGIGLGFDSYTDWRSIPLYGYVAVDFATIRPNAFYLFVSGGYSKSWYAPGQEDGAPGYDVEYGGNFNAMLGYRIQANQFRIYVATGYKFQRIDYSYTYPYWWDSSRPAPLTSVEMDMNRFVIQLGFGFK
jgi:hypothetical protein